MSILYHLYTILSHYYSFFKVLEQVYYLATTGSEAENVPEGVLGLEDVYKDIANKTVDRDTDSNKDGISDYYTKLICEGKLLTSKNTQIFGNATYEEVQANADYDGDGLLNGEEVKIMETGSAVYGKIISYPTKPDSDNDGLDDFQEVKMFGTSPLKYNISIEKTDVAAITDGNNFYSNLYLNLYNSSNFERGSVVIGNGFFGNVTDQTILYQMVLIDYLKQIDESLLEERSLSKYNQLLKQSYSSLLDSTIEEFKKSIDENDSSKIKDILECINNIQSFQDASLPDEFGKVDFPPLYKNCIDSITNFVARGELSKAKQESERLRTLIKSIPQGDDDFYNKALSNLYDNLIQNSVKVDKIDATIKNPFEIDMKSTGGKVTIAFDVLSFVILELNIEEIKSESTKQYCSLLANMDLLIENIYILDSIIATTDNPYLLNAAKNLQKYAVDVANNKLDLMGIKRNFDSDYQSVINAEIIHNALGSGTGQYVVSVLIPYVGEVIAAAMMATEAVRDFGNICFKMDKISKAASLTIASTQTAEILSNHYINQLKGGNATDANGNANTWVAYSDFSDKLYVYFLNLTVILMVSEDYMKSNNKEVDSEGHKVYDDFYFNKPKEIRNGCAKNIDDCNALLDKYSKKLCDYFEYIAG